MGTNPGYSTDWNYTGAATIEDAENLVNQFKMIADWIRPTSKDFIFLGFYGTSYIESQSDDAVRAWWDYYHKRMKEEFGRRFFDVKEYLANYVWDDCGYSRTSTDINRINIGRYVYTPISFGDSGGIHLKSKATCGVVNALLDRMYELGLINNGYQKIDISTIPDGDNQVF